MQQRGCNHRCDVIVGFGLHVCHCLVFSERELMHVHVRYMSSSVRLSVVCRLSSVVCLSSVTFVHPTQAIEIFGNVSTPFGTFAICDPSVKILRRSSQGNPSVEGSNQREVEKCNDFGPKRCKIRGKLLSMSNRKSYMSFRLVPNSVTLNDIERGNKHNGSVISPNSVAFKVHVRYLISR